MPDIIQVVRGEGCLEVPFASFWKALRRPHAPSPSWTCPLVLSDSRRRLFPSVLPMEGPAPHRGLVQVCFDGPCVKVFFHKNSSPACQNQELSSNRCK